jgi:1-propanol dehydrogenase
LDILLFVPYELPFSVQTTCKGGVVMGQFSCPTKIMAGDARSLLPQLGAKKLLLVADPFFQDGLARHLAEATGARVEYFFEVEPDPTVALAAKGAALVKSFQPDTVVALGGGSAMDLAKSMTWFSGVPAALVAIPTTSGSGSEVTDFAILTHEGVKHPLVDGQLRPRVAILDPSLVEKLPKGLIADGGFDALTHALEAYTATDANAFTDALAAAAFARVLGSLKASFEGDLTARGAIHEGATMAGLAFTQGGLGLCHAMAHALGGQLHLPHGRLNAILLPAVMEINAPSCGSRYADLARRAGLEGRSDAVAIRNLRNSLLRLRRELGLPETLAQAGAVLPADREALVAAVLADPCCGTNPMPVTGEMVRHVLRQVAGHG